mgnify:CR=1 FL=1
MDSLIENILLVQPPSSIFFDNLGEIHYSIYFVAIMNSAKSFALIFSYSSSVIVSDSTSMLKGIQFFCFKNPREGYT